MIVDESTHGTHSPGSGSAASLRSIAAQGGDRGCRLAGRDRRDPAYAGAESVVAEAVSVLSVGLGATLVMALVRCRRYEVTIGRRMIELRLGPFRRILPTGCVEKAAEQPASSWRRLYAPWELVLTMSVETRPLIVPTNDPDELRAVLCTKAPD